jgi:hypothetical protein
MLKVLIEPERARVGRPLKDVPNGMFFDGAIDGIAGPFLKVGSVSQSLWIVVRVRCMEGQVYTSTRPSDESARVLDYAPIPVREVVLRGSESPPDADAVDPHAGSTGKLSPRDEKDSAS